MKPEQPFEITQADFAEIYTSYCEIVENLVRKSPEGIRDYAINYDAFADALHEIEQDLSIIQFRRLRKAASKGISKGKIAGIHAFRLSRTPIVNFGSEQHTPEDKSINTVAALALALDTVGISATEIKPAICHEILYNMSKRHVNQETLALVIDALTA
ncbi:hypothetical protein [Rivihabitans pingtungensis]|uniref:hypothetical protein n=1 Tax=Rivihabitans pingtungensis TaxID=1054498 RepID=UPI002356DFA5|nr:hypothetical protein [Rivihabitans pingtungensis]MCK6436731.1 hypothetical protein [Rivihabitans pingtungensis]